MPSGCFLVVFLFVYVSTQTFTTSKNIFSFYTPILHPSGTIELKIAYERALFSVQWYTVTIATSLGTDRSV